MSGETRARELVLNLHLYSTLYARLGKPKLHQRPQRRTEGDRSPAILFFKGAVALGEALPLSGLSRR